ncbi:hypothetical protein PUR61_17085 [Streptomyces sp. BE20]|uniref:DUF6884 domain-containing protein n=1 Tax=Streptomyces sp. BE20 TaxID=3002525 RepID=UPI002E7A23FE|nr:DUF6884 domain-containing protein [Streptomyces sp. BE20]MEE1823893.1 hypothetical protein [Streptomyces sp. BE20]
MAADIRGLVVVGCSKEKTVTSRPVPALDLYQGWCVPALRHRLAPASPERTRVLVLSAHYGLVTADAPLLTYEQPMTPARAQALREPVRQALAEHLAAHPADEALLLLAPDYLDVLGPLPLDVVHTITDPITHLDAVHRVLDSWSWPCP